MEDPAAQPATDAERELAARRRDLEHEFQDKVRDLKAQVKRQQESLQQDRLDWEATKRTQAKEVADRAERVKRQEENHKRDAAALKSAQAELERTKERLRETQAAKVEAKEASAGEDAAKAQLRSARSLLAGTSFVALAGGAASLVAALSWDRPAAFVAAGLTLLLAAACEVARRRSVWASKQ